MKKICLLIAVICLLAGACDNFFHNLVPPSDDRIISFEINGQISPEIIDDNTITVLVDSDVDVSALIPKIAVSPKASVIPLTLEYIQAAFPNVNVKQEAYTLSITNDIPAYVINLIEKNKDTFNVPEFDIPIDFTDPVQFIVISAAGDIRIYTVYIEKEIARIISFSFAKYDNPELVIDARGEINVSANSITANAWYPVEMTLSYLLIPSFAIDGDSLLYNGIPLVSGETSIQFNQLLGKQSITVTLVKGTETIDYILNVIFAEDPDTVRSITDFRFVKFNNSSLAADAVGSITNTGDTGTILVQVLYQGSIQPENLIPRFISPGTVTVNGIQQDSGITSQDFTSPLQYRVVSKSGQYVRIYTVVIELISVSSEAPRILSFKFPFVINNDLVMDAQGNINDSTEEITVQVMYSGYIQPDVLIPEFTAQGLVSVYGVTQISGLSEQNFSRSLRYTVTNPVNPSLKRDYLVRCIFVRDDSSDAGITFFGFYPENNRDLTQILSARIDQNTGKITLYAPIGSGITARTMYPQFSATGHVTVDGVTQRSGVNGRIFDSPVEYKVTSANGQITRTYIVDVKELGTTIYVNINASGLNDGTSWQNAYISLKAACEAAQEFDREIPKEIWIAKGTYSPANTDDFFPVAPNTYYIGGFAGNESSASQRNIVSNPVIISGNPAKLANNNIHAVFFNRSILLHGEDVYFEDIKFENFTHTNRTATNFTYVPISLRWWSNAEGTIYIKNCSFTNVNGYCIETDNGNIRMENVTANRIASMYSNIKAPASLNLATNDYLNNVTITEQIVFGNKEDYPLFILYGGNGANSQINITNFDVQNIKLGTRIHGNNAAINITDYEVQTINTENYEDGNLGGVFEIYNGTNINFNNINIDGGSAGSIGRSFLGSIFINEAKGRINFKNIDIKNISVPVGNEFGGAAGICVNYPTVDGVVYSSGNVDIENVKLTNLGKRQSPTFHIYQPGADINMKDITVEVNSNATGYPVYFRSFRRLDGELLRFRASTSSGTFTFAGDTAGGEINITDLQGQNGSVSFSGSNKEVKVNNVNGTNSGLNVSTSNRNVTVWDINTSLLGSSISSSGNYTVSVTDYTSANASLSVTAASGTLNALRTSGSSSSFTANSGTINAQNITTTGGAANLTASSGTIYAQNITAAGGGTTFSASSGAIEARYIAATGRASFSGNSATIIVNDVTACAGATFSVGSGSVTASDTGGIITVNRVTSNDDDIRFSSNSSATINVTDITSNRGGIEFNCIKSNITVTNVFSTKYASYPNSSGSTAGPNFSFYEPDYNSEPYIGNTGSNITINNIEAWDLSVRGYATLTLTNAEVGRSTFFSSAQCKSVNGDWNSSVGTFSETYSNFTHKKTEITELIMLDPTVSNPATGFANNKMNFIGGEIKVEDSVFYVNYSMQENDKNYYTSRGYSIDRMDARMYFNNPYYNIDTIETGGAITANFNKCKFYSLSTYRINYYDQTNVHTYSFLAGIDSSLIFTECNFISNNNSSNQGIVYAGYGGSYDLDTVTIQNYYTANKIFHLTAFQHWVNMGTGRIRSNCTINGQGIVMGGMGQGYQFYSVTEGLMNQDQASMRNLYFYY